MLTAAKLKLPKDKRRHRICVSRNSSKQLFIGSIFGLHERPPHTTTHALCALMDTGCVRLKMP